MKRASLFLLSLGLSLGLAAATPVPGEPGANAMHPLIRPVDAAGVPVKNSGRAMDAKASCGSCHDVPFIQANSRHWGEKAKVDCLACHLPGGALPRAAAAYEADGRLKREWNALQDPKAEACLACHGAGSLERKPLVLPESYLAAGGLDQLHAQHFSRMAGTVFSPQAPRDSGLDLAGKAALTAPWDVHAARLLQCASCHSTPNGPGRQASGPDTLTRDPRRQDLAQYLKRPDHRLVVQDCRQCHDASKTHGFLPYAQRHMDRLACQACHVPEVNAPILMEEDRTLALRDGTPRQVWRNMEGAGPLNTRLVGSFKPWLLPVSATGGTRLAPVNVVTERAWVDASGREVAWPLVRKAWGADAPEHAAGPAGQAALKSIGMSLKALGVSEPHSIAVARVVPIVHGVQTGDRALRRCVECHAAGGRMDPSARLSLGAASLPTLDGASQSAGLVSADAAGALLSRPPLPSRLTLPGQGWKALSARLGFAFFVMTFIGVAGHALFRLATAKRRRHLAHAPVKRVYLYGAYERLWHWLMAASTLLLVYTGFSIHFTGSGPLLGLRPAVSLHNALAVVLLLNAFLSLFYHVATRNIRQFLPPGATLWQDVLAQARYYLDGIFAGAPHPSPKGVQRKLNALQQLTYMGLLNVLFPFQVLTGVLLWMAGHWPGLLEPAGGLAVLTPLHDLGSWLLLSFTVGHVYLTTTGHTLTSNLKAMVDGYDMVDADDVKGGKP